MSTETEPTGDLATRRRGKHAVTTPRLTSGHNEQGPRRVRLRRVRAVAEPASDGTLPFGRRFPEAARRLGVREKLDKLVTAEKEDIGCVVRALESAFVENASNEETIQRFRDIKEIDKIPPEDLFLSDTARIRTYYEWIRKRGISDLGKEMKPYDIYEADMSVSEIIQAITDENFRDRKIIIYMLENDDPDQPHLAHIGYDKSTSTFRRLSDDTDMVFTMPEYHCYIFDKSTESGTQQAA